MIVDGKYVDEREVAFGEKYSIESEGHKINWYRLSEWLMIRTIGKEFIQTKTGTQLADVGPLDAPTSFTLGLSDGCFQCGERVKIAFDGKTFRAMSACKYRFGGIPHVFMLNVPSGTLAVANDLRSLVEGEPPCDDEEGWKSGMWRQYDVNSDIGCVNTSLWYAEQGLAHAFVGNTCPGVYELSEDHYQISSGHNDDEGNYFFPPGNGVASICTDLWWYSIMDGAEFEARGGEWDRFTEMVSVKAGLWKFTHHWAEHTFDRDAYAADIIYTDIEWAGEALV